MSISQEYVYPPSLSTVEANPLHDSSEGFRELRGISTVSHAHSIVNPMLWSAERPNIYTLVVSLRDTVEGFVIQAESCRVGFRTVGISNGTLLVNSKPILIRGVNISEYDPYAGFNYSKRLMEADLRIMKRHNFNAIRTYHSPADTWLYELCNLYGFYVVNEANIETRGMKPYAGKLADDPKWESAYFLRLKRAFGRDKNHPCIIAWSLGNQSGYGVVHDVMAQWIRSVDSSRIVMYEPASYGSRVTLDDHHPKFMATDVLCPNNPKISDCIVLANRFPDYPLVLNSYTHMQGSSGDSMEDYWKAFYTYSRLQGGFIEDWLDDGLAAHNFHGDAFWSSGGDYGQSTTKERFSLNGLNWPDRGLGHQMINANSMWSCSNDSR